jgi:hypothetical protein
MATIPYQTMRQATIPYPRPRPDASLSRRVRQAMTWLLTVIGLGGTSADTIDALLEQERIQRAPSREQAREFGPPLNLMMASSLRPSPRAPFDRN